MTEISGVDKVKIAELELDGILINEFTRHQKNLKMKDRIEYGK